MILKLAKYLLEEHDTQNFNLKHILDKSQDLFQNVCEKIHSNADRPAADVPGIFSRAKAQLAVGNHVRHWDRKELHGRSRLIPRAGAKILEKYRFEARR